MRFTMSTNVVGAACYSISKGALNIAVAKYAVEYKEDGIIFVALSPGLVKTIQGKSKSIHIE